MSQREGNKVDLQSYSSASSFSHLEAKIRQTHSLARLLTSYAEQLLQEYVQHQGDPFGLPSFSPPGLPVPGLNSPAPAHSGLPTLERLQLDAAALNSLSPLLDDIRRLQADLNPFARRLLRRLEDASHQSRALGSAVEVVLGALGATPGPPGPHPMLPESPGVFLAKLLGYRVCGLYQEWVICTEGDLGQLLRAGLG
ncbi:cardiotrophin-1-like isoform X2 [Vombatus ursinus]|uniref:Cardiotrophin-1 n=1 Tax=Vombatus ursinus TaxID=29139 RepID=A0A4X2LMU0_VOMUR|nr:cardiotrophin-1-like isoform X2 [Vombatus ursinus]